MMDTMTMQRQGHVPGGARLVASGPRVTFLPMSRTWRPQSVTAAFLGCHTTGVAEFASNDYVGNATDPAGTTGLTSIKPTTRHLAARST